MTAIHVVGDETPTEEMDPALAAVLSAPLPDLRPDDCEPGVDLIVGPFLRPHLYGLHPYLVEQELPAAVKVLDVLPRGARVLRVHRHNSTTGVLAAGDGTLIVVRSWKRSADCWVSGVDRDVVERLSAQIKAKVTVTRNERALRVTFWHLGRQQPMRWSREIVVPRWGQITRLYPAVVRTAIDALVTYRATDASVGGRLLLWHGPPGTGKTTAVRALLDAWRGWAAPHVVSDADKLLNEGDYLTRVLIDSDEDDDATPWRIVVVEDAAELLRADARAHVGSALGRLLNTADGLLGQGSKALVLLTTNEPIGEMHPALLRPGRCLARIEFPPLDAEEATAVLGSPATTSMTLAEVMQRRGELTRLEAVVPASRPGNYL